MHVISSPWLPWLGQGRNRLILHLYHQCPQLGFKVFSYTLCETTLRVIGSGKLVCQELFSFQGFEAGFCESKCYCQRHIEKLQHSSVITKLAKIPVRRRTCDWDSII